jgi:hypothetical protein
MQPQMPRAGREGMITDVGQQLGWNDERCSTKVVYLLSPREGRKTKLIDASLRA